MHDTNLLEDQPIAWTPTPDVIERSQLTRFMRQVGVTTWDELYEFSIRDVEKFTEEVLKFLDIKFDPPYTQLLDTSDGVEFPTWLTAETGDGRQETGDVRPEQTPVSCLLSVVSCLICWLGDRDSNPDRQIQRLQSYH